MRGAGADSWDYTAPEWIVATQEENTLSVNAKDNTEASRQKFSTNIKFRWDTAGTLCFAGQVLFTDSQHSVAGIVKAERLGFRTIDGNR